MSINPTECSCSDVCPFQNVLLTCKNIRCYNIILEGAYIIMGHLSVLGLTLKALNKNCNRQHFMF